MTERLARRAFAVAFCASVMATRARAEEKAAPPKDEQEKLAPRSALAPERPLFGGGRVLDRLSPDGKQLIFRNIVPYPAFVPTSFTATYVGLRISGEMQSSDVHPVAGLSTFSQVAASETLEMAWRVVPSFPLAVVADLQANGASGINDGSILANGTLFSAGYHVGAIFDFATALLRKHSRWQLAVNLQGGQSVGDTIVAQNAINAISSDPRSQSFVDTVSQTASAAVGQIVTHFHDWSFSGYATWAYAFNSHFAVQGAAGMDYLERSLSPVTRTNSVTSLRFTALPRIATAVSIDPATRYFPLALLLESSIAPTTQHDDLGTSKTFGTSTWAAGVYYSHPDHPDLHLELLGYVRTGAIGDPSHAVGSPLVEPNSRTWGVQAVGRYIW